MQNLTETSLLLPEVISLRDLAKLWAGAGAASAQEKAAEVQKRGAMLAFPPKCPHCLDKEFGGDFSFVVRHGRIRVLAKPWAA